jgi:Domain of unknown function (DUF4304)
VDSHLVTRAIRQHIHPLLKQEGFLNFSSRSHWRHKSNRIEVINFQSFSSYLAHTARCTTFSFAINLGIFFPAVPPEHEVLLTSIKKKNDKLLPQEHSCHFRKQVHKIFKQPELENPGIWYIDAEGIYLDSAIKDARDAIIQDALPWFARLSSDEEVLRILLEDGESFTKGWGFGSNLSANRSYLTGYIALELGKYELAEKVLKVFLETSKRNAELLKQKVDQKLEERVERDIQIAINANN